MFFFDIRGHRVHQHGEFGCPRTSTTCHFVHPSDPEWESVVRGEGRRFSDDHSARRSPGSPPRGRDRRRSPSLDRQRSALSPRRQRTPPRGSVRVRSPVRRHDSSRSPRRDDHPPPHYHDRDVRPPRRSSSHERLTLAQRIDLNPRPDHVPPKAPPKLVMSHTSSRDRPSEQEAKSSPITPAKGIAPAPPSSATTSKPSSETASKPSGPVAAPSHRPFSEVLPPPPIQKNSSQPSDDVTTPEQRRAVWERRITLMADATKEFMELDKLGQDMQMRRRQVQSPGFAALPSDVKATFQTGLTNAESAYQKKKDSFNSLINKLSETDFWPPVPSQRAGELEAKLKEAKTMLGGLADGVGQLYKRIEGLYEQRSGGPKRSGPDEDVEMADGAIRTKKRRRLSINGSDDTTPSDIREDVESIKNTIREIDDHLHEVENDISQHSCHVMEMLEEKIEEKIEEIARNADVSSLVEVRLGPQTTKTFQAYSESFAQADREIGELAQEVAELIPKLDSLKRENDLFKQEEATSKELLAELVKADQENAEALARLQADAESLGNTLKAQANRATRSSLPSLPTYPIPKPFMDAITTSVQQQVHEQILPILAETRIDTERIANARDMELYERLVGDKTDQSSKLAQLVSAWIERHPDYVHQALTAVTASAKDSGAGGSGRAST
ncbi:hypothetical protein EDB87DRAFT_1681478 [Lactarius vividus]|nr:hypothetical protein EDB87DRAFT_1681478 [Lactarius vividus]